MYALFSFLQDLARGSGSSKWPMKYVYGGASFVPRLAAHLHDLYYRPVDEIYAGPTKFRG